MADLEPFLLPGETYITDEELNYRKKKKFLSKYFYKQLCHLVDKINKYEMEKSDNLLGFSSRKERRTESRKKLKSRDRTPLTKEKKPLSKTGAGFKRQSSIVHLIGNFNKTEARSSKTHEGKLDFLGVPQKKSETSAGGKLLQALN